MCILETVFHSSDSVHDQEALMWNQEETVKDQE